MSIKIENNRAYWYMFLPYTYTSFSSKSFDAVNDLNVIDCRLIEDNDNYSIYIDVKKDSFFSRGISDIMRTHTYETHYQLGGLNGNIVRIIFKYPGKERIEKFKQGKYSELYYKDTLRRPTIKNLFKAGNIVKGGSYNKFYYVMLKSKSYFDKFIEPLTDGNKELAKELFKKEFDQKPDLNLLILSKHNLELHEA